ncbi:Polyprenyl synthetase [Cryptosporidium felis]|nr:Polyprenyl synthetase [Cryptosporidium felis]
MSEQTPTRNVDIEDKRRISYSLSVNRRQNLQRLIKERNNQEKNDAINKIGGFKKAISIESQIVCLERVNGRSIILILRSYLINLSSLLNKLWNECTFVKGITILE